ncbi:hypothetical protein K402DRAFT_464033 [Aulographum hederae CBS 113979]|uniref:Uncharacterized protein n=1 Tax=Aulographum hederae CBS 113979 TaxID=1176131 RepID=A0A6G1GYL5_9PEZI|nr:hypothetical protein K402DRAFT_464033 [Aulographum hederae CBS 113979]
MESAPDPLAQPANHGFETLGHWIESPGIGDLTGNYKEPNFVHRGVAFRYSTLHERIKARPREPEPDPRDFTTYTATADVSLMTEDMPEWVSRIIPDPVFITDPPLLLFEDRPVVSPRTGRSLRDFGSNIPLQISSRQAGGFWFKYWFQHGLTREDFLDRVAPTSVAVMIDVDFKDMLRDRSAIFCASQGCYDNQVTSEAHLTDKVSVRSKKILGGLTNTQILLWQPNITTQTMAQKLSKNLISSTNIAPLPGPRQPPKTMTPTLKALDRSLPSLEFWHVLMGGYMDWWFEVNLHGMSVQEIDDVRVGIFNDRACDWPESYLPSLTQSNLPEWVAWPSWYPGGAAPQ